MVKSHVCSKCDKLLASPQSLWNHKQRCQVHNHYGITNRGVKSTITMESQTEVSSPQSLWNHKQRCQVHNHYGITNRGVKSTITMESQTEVSSPQSLWNHKQRCQGNPHVGENMLQEDGFQDANQKRSTTSTFDAYNKSSKNPKIRALLNEIFNDNYICKSK